MRWVGGSMFLLAAALAVADDSLRQAAEALEKNDFAAAIPLLQAALEADSENTNARFNLAYAFLQTGDEANAIAQYQAVVDEKPDLIPARQNLAMLLMRNDRPSEAADDLAFLAQAKPEDYSVHLSWADALDKSGDLSGAVEPYTKAVELQPNSIDALLGLGYVLARQQRFVDAVPYYLRAAKIDPKVEQMTLQLADSMEQAGQQTDALELYRRYARGHPDEAAVQERIGIILLERKRFREAGEALEIAVATDATVANRAALAEVYAHLGNAAKGLSQLREVVISDPKSAELRVRYANGLLASGEIEKASQQYLTAVELDADTVDAWNGLAFTMFQGENYPAALKALGNAEKLGSRKPAGTYLRALAQDKMQLYEEARLSYQAFLAMSPEMADEEWKAGERLKVIEKVLAKR